MTPKSIPKSIRNSLKKSTYVFMDFSLILSSKMPPKSSRKPKKNEAEKTSKKLPKNESTATCLSKGTGSAFYFTDIPNFPKSLTVSLCEANLSEHRYASIAALARLRSRAALAKRLALGYRVSSRFLWIREDLQGFPWIH